MQGFIIINPYDYIDTVNATKDTLNRPQSIGGKCKKRIHCRRKEVEKDFWMNYGFTENRAEEKTIRDPL